MVTRNSPGDSASRAERDRFRLLPFRMAASGDNSTSPPASAVPRLLHSEDADDRRLAEEPSPWRSRYAIIKDVINDARRDEVTSVAGSMAYTTLFALVPLLLFLTALSGFVSRWVGTDDVVDNVTNWLFKSLPVSTAAAVLDPIETVLTKQASGLLSISAVLAIWGGKSAITSAMSAVNKAYGRRDSRSWFARTGMAIGLTLGLGLGLVLSSTALLIGSRWGDRASDWLGVGSEFADAWSYARWPLIGLLLLLGLTLFFWIAPDTTMPFRWALPGAVFTLLGWAAATFGLAYYFAMAGSYATAYGTLGGVLAFVFWLYVMSLVLILGGELNAAIDHHRSRDIAPATGLPVWK